MYPCNYKTNIFKSLKQKIFGASLGEDYTPIKLYADKLITFSQYEKLISDSNSFDSSYYYPLSVIIEVKMKLFKKYIKSNKGKFKWYFIVIVLVVASFFSFQI